MGNFDHIVNAAYTILIYTPTNGSMGMLQSDDSACVTNDGGAISAAAVVSKCSECHQRHETVLFFTSTQK